MVCKGQVLIPAANARLEKRVGQCAERSLRRGGSASAESCVLVGPCLHQIGKAALVAYGVGVIAEVADDLHQTLLLRSLAENMARRNPAPGEILTEVERLKKEGLTLHEISARLDVDTTTISGLLALKRAGEQRLLDAALSGRIPIGVAVDIARTEGIETQRELLKACESKQLTQAALRMIRRVMDRRRLIGKQRGNGPRRPLNNVR